MAVDHSGPPPEEAEAETDNPEHRTLLEVINHALPRLRKSERKVVQVVLNDPSRVIHLSMSALAEIADVSEPTIMRFCNSIGCDGFHSFKLQLAQALALGLSSTHAAIRRGDGSADLVGKIFDHTLSSLDRARRNLDPQAVASAIEVLVAAEDILFVGFGASGIIAQDAQQKFPLFGVPCQAPADAHQQFMAATMSGPRSVTVAISNTGRTGEVLRVARAAKQAGAKVIGMSGTSGPLLRMADVALLVKTFEDTDFYTPTISRLAGLVVIDILATGVALSRDPSHLERIRFMKEQLTSMRSEFRTQTPILPGAEGQPVRTNGPSPAAADDGAIVEEPCSKG